MQKSIDLKSIALVTDDEPISLTAYDPDNCKGYYVKSDLKSLKAILNFNSHADHPRANFTSIQTLFFIHQMTDEQVDSLLTETYFLMPSKIKEQVAFKTIE